MILLSVQVISAVFLSQCDFRGWCFLSLFDETIGEDNVLSYEEKIQYPCNIASLLGADFKNTIAQWFGIRLTQLWAVGFQKCNRC